MPRSSSNSVCINARVYNVWCAQFEVITQVKLMLGCTGKSEFCSLLYHCMMDHGYRTSKVNHDNITRRWCQYTEWCAHVPGKSNQEVSSTTGNLWTLVICTLKGHALLAAKVREGWSLGSLRFPHSSVSTRTYFIGTVEGVPASRTAKSEHHRTTL